MVPPVSTITGYSVLVAFHVIFVVTIAFLMETKPF